MPRLYGENFFRVEGSFAHPSYPGGRSGGRANFSYISVQSVANDVANRLDDKQTVGLPRGVACLAVTLLVGPTFLHITILSRVKSVKMRQSEYAPPLLSALSSSKGVNVFGSCRCSRKLSQLGEWPSFPWLFFLISAGSKIADGNVRLAPSFVPLSF